MALAIGSRIGAFEITGSLGAGGMGEVYRARDTRLDRDVAIKVLPELYAQDPERLARFEREAKALASLNHPNIAAIFGLEESPAEAGHSVRSLVLELVEGPTLADRIAEGPLPVHEAMAVARQVADALQAAHDLGVIHRDLKPANIKLRPDGTVKVLDFGLAKILEREPLSPSQTVSPTLSVQATLAGVVLGTAGYMSPEQARGKTVDRRTDIWSFGCVLFEMLAGTRAFEGDDFTVTIAAVVRGDPDWSALPSEVPESIRLLLRRCLDKDPRTRVADIAVARFLLTETITTTTPRHGDRLPRRHPRMWMVAGLSVVAGVALAALGAWAMLKARPPAPAPSVRFTIIPQSSQFLVDTADGRDVVVSPDGSRVVFTMRMGARTGANSFLAMRAIDQIEPQILAGTEGGRSPFMSPDGRWVGFFVLNGSVSEIKKVPITGGQSSTVARAQGVARGASWGDDDRIVFGTSDLTTGLLAVPSSGGQPTVLTKARRGELDHQYPSVLAGARAILFTITGENGSPSGRRIAVLDASSGQVHVLAQGRSPEYVPPGILLFESSRGSQLMAAAFNASTLKMTSEPHPVLEHYSPADFTVSRSGTLAYLTGDQSGGAPRSLVWVSREGREEPIAAAPQRAYTLLRLSPDGTKVALDIRDSGNDIWTWDLQRQVLTQITFDPAEDATPAWIDNERIAFSSARTGVRNLYMQRADGTGVAEQLASTAQFMVLGSASSDGKQLAFMENGNLGLLSLDRVDVNQRSDPASRPSTPAPMRRIRELTNTSWVEDNPEISPDGRWLAYQSGEEGRSEVFVRSLEDWDRIRVKVSKSGGRMPLWARNERELFYLDENNMLTAVPVQTGTTFTAGKPVRLLNSAYVAGASNRSYDVSPDGQRFLMIKENAPAGPPPAPPSIIVVTNWVDELNNIVRSH